MAVPLNPPGFQYSDNNGDPLAGGLIYTYEAGTAFGTPKATYTDAGAGTPNDNPVELEAAGRASIWISGSYGIIVKTALGVTIDTEDNVPSFASGTIGATVTDTGFVVQNASDLTKQFQFSLANLTTGTTTIGSVPDGNFTFASIGNITAAFKDKIMTGLVLSNNVSDATNDIDISAGVCVSDDGTTIMTVAALTKRLDAAWAVGTNQGGLDTGSIADTTYHLWVINRTDTNVTDVLFSTSASAPTMPANYTKKKCIGSIVRASSAILGFFQSKNVFMYNTVPAVSSVGATAGTAAITMTLAVPTGVKFLALCSGVVANGSNYVYISSLDNADMAPSTTVSPLATIGNTTAVQFSAWTNTSAQVRTRQTTNSANGYAVATLGWTDSRI